MGKGAGLRLEHFQGLGHEVGHGEVVGLVVLVVKGEGLQDLGAGAAVDGLVEVKQQVGLVGDAGDAYLAHLQFLESQA